MRDGLKVVCDRCNCELEHVCNPDLPEAAVSLYRFKPEGASSLVPAMKKTGYYSEGDENAPFFSEAFLYSLLGKENARSVLALINNLVRQAGLDPYAMGTRGIAEEIAKERETAEIETNRLKRTLQEEEERKPVSERVVDGVKVKTYGSFTALDNAIYMLGKSGKQFASGKIDEVHGVVIVPEKTGKVAHEASLDDAKKWTRYHFVSYGRRADDVWDRRRVGEALKPVLKQLVVGAQEAAVADAKPEKHDEKTLIFANARALDEALFDAYLDFNEKLRKRHESMAVDKYHGRSDKSLSDMDIQALRRTECYVNPRIQPFVGLDYALIDIDGISYGALASDLAAVKTEDTPEGRLLSQGFAKLVRLAKRKGAK